MTVDLLIKKLKELDGEAVVICEDSSGGWDNVIDIKKSGSSVSILFGGGSPFSDEK